MALGASESFLPRLRSAGVSERDIATIAIDNPRRLLTIALPIR